MNLKDVSGKCSYGYWYLIKSRTSQYATETIKQLMPKHFGRRLVLLKKCDKETQVFHSWQGNKLRLQLGPMVLLFSQWPYLLSCIGLSQPGLIYCISPSAHPGNPIQENTGQTLSRGTGRWQRAGAAGWYLAWIYHIFTMAACYLLTIAELSRLCVDTSPHLAQSIC